MSETQLEEFLENSQLKKYQRELIKETDKKTNMYADYDRWQSIHDANNYITECQNYIILQGIFIEQDLYEKLFDACKSLRTAILHREYVQYNLGAGEWEKAIAALGEAEKLILEIKTEIRKHLWDTKLN